MRAAWLLAAALLLGGCTAPSPAPPTSPPTAPPSTPPAPPGPPSEPLAEGFDGADALPAGWVADAGAWQVEANASAASPPNVLRGTGGGARSTLRAPGTYTDLDATVRFLLVSGDEGAGLSFRYAGEGDYRIVRYSPREAGWHYFIVEGGQADKRNEATLPPAVAAPQPGEWVVLRVQAEGARIRAWQGETLVLDYADPTGAQAGAVGPFLRGRAVALFDDLAVQPRPAS